LADGETSRLGALFAFSKPMNLLGTSLTHHAQTRTRQRLTMEAAAVAGLLDRGWVVSLAREWNSPKVHRLFFSVRDQHWFVAFQDEQDRHLITVWPLEFYQKSCWEIGKCILREAQRLVAPASGKLPAAGELASHGDGRVYRAYGVILQSDRQIRRVHFGLWPVGPVELPIEQLLASQFFHDELEARILRELRPGEEVGLVSIRRGKKGHVYQLTPATLQLPELPAAARSATSHKTLHALN